MIAERARRELRAQSVGLQGVAMLGLVSASLLLSGCKDDSYAVVSVLTRADSVSGVAQFRVYVDNAAAEDVLLYPQEPTENLTLDTTHPITFSVEFDSTRGGSPSFGVEPLSLRGDPVGYGTASGSLAQNGVANVTVFVELGARRPLRGIDAGAGFDSGTSGLTCNPYAPAVACGPDRTCGLLCNQGEPAVGMCYASGGGSPGDTCASNNDCAPGSQCFTFSAVGCSVMTCLRFCDHNDAACGETGTYCNVPIVCGTTSPSFAACSRPCDPTGIGTIGCATGLGCFVYADESTDCACPGFGAVGSPCTQNSGCNGEPGCAGCAAGASCVVPTQTDAGAGGGTCRPICNLAAPSCPSGTTCHAFDQSTRRLYGFCQ
jgi:hypothetical protein